MKNPLQKKEDPRATQVQAEAERKLAEIAQIKDPHERLKCYEALSDGLQEMYDDGAPRGTERLSCVGGGGMIGLVAGAGALALIAPYAAAPVIGLYLGGGALAGSGFFGGGDALDRRAHLKKKFGSVAYARQMYKLQQEVGKKLAAEKKTVEALDADAKFRSQFEKTFGKKEDPAEAARPQEAAQAPAAATKEAKAEAEKPATPEKKAAAEKPLGKPDYDRFRNFGS
jgi:hypothetical protein